MKTQLPYKIEHGVPIPGRNGLPGLGEMLDKMKAGDSFVAPKKQRSSIINVAHRMGIGLVTRKIDAEQMRVWRVAPPTDQGSVHFKPEQTAKAAVIASR